MISKGGLVYARLSWRVPMAIESDDQIQSRKIMKISALRPRFTIVIAEAKSIVPQYDVVVTALNFVKMFDFAKDKVHVIGVKNVLSEQEIKEKILESGVCGQ